VSLLLALMPNQSLENSQPMQSDGIDIESEITPLR
jgi:hypothetical protein